MCCCCTPVPFAALYCARALRILGPALASLPQNVDVFCYQRHCSRLSYLSPALAIDRDYARDHPARTLPYIYILALVLVLPTRCIYVLYSPHYCVTACTRTPRVLLFACRTRSCIRCPDLCVTHDHCVYSHQSLGRLALCVLRICTPRVSVLFA